MKIKTATTFKEKFFGLMGKTHINYGLYFPNTKAIHTFFMKEPIDIIGLSSINIITEIKPNVLPNKIIILKRSVHALELPKGSTKKYKIGDKVRI